MRGIIGASIAALGLVVTVSTAQAGPIVVRDPFATVRPPLVEIGGGCGRGWHPVHYVNHWGRWRVRCVPNHHW